MTFQEFICEARTITPEVPFNNVFVVLGLPGAGKTTLYKSGVFNVANTVLLTPDLWIELLSKKENIDIKTPTNTSTLYNRVIKKHNRVSSNVITKAARSNFIIETLGRDIFRLKDILIRAKKRDMRVIVVLVHVDLKTAIANNALRARSVPGNIIKDAYNKIENNFNFLVTSGEVDEAWRIDNNTNLNYADLRTSNFIRRIK
jgi:hypothetical protein